jgi:hypothetical protein
VGNLKYFRRTITNQNYIREKIKKRFNSVFNLLSFRLLYKKLWKKNIEKNIGLIEQGAQGNILTQEGGSNRRIEKIAQTGPS